MPSLVHVQPAVPLSHGLSPVCYSLCGEERQMCCRDSCAPQSSFLLSDNNYPLSLLSTLNMFIHLCVQAD